MVALLARETLQMVDVSFGSHNHFECRNQFIARRTETRIPIEPTPFKNIQNELIWLLLISLSPQIPSPHVITFAQKKILSREQCGADVAEPTIATATFQAILVPK